MSLVEEGVLDARLAPSLRIHLDWIQYKTNFRDPVIVRRTTESAGADRCRWPRLRSICARPMRRACPTNWLRRCKNIGAGPDVERLQPRLPGRLQAVSRLSDLGLQPAVLAAPRRLGSGVGQGIRGGAARRLAPTPIIRRRSPTRWPTSGRCCAISRSARSAARRRSSASRSASAPARARRRGSIGSRRSTRSAARASIRACTSSSATTRRPASSARCRRSRITASTSAACRSTRSTRSSRCRTYRFKMMYVHLTNVYDNLPFDDLVRRDGKLYLVEVRPYLNGRGRATRLTADFGLTARGASGHREAAARRAGPTRCFPASKRRGVLARALGRLQARRAAARARRSRRGSRAARA